MAIKFGLSNGAHLALQRNVLHLALVWGHLC